MKPVNSAETRNRTFLGRITAPVDSTFEVQGLGAGERVVAAGGHRLREGETVRIYDGMTSE